VGGIRNLKVAQLRQASASRAPIVRAKTKSSINRAEQGATEESS